MANGYSAGVGFGDGNSIGLTLGAEQNHFGDGTTNRTAVMMLVDGYATANPDWLASYDSNIKNYIVLDYKDAQNNRYKEALVRHYNEWTIIGLPTHLNLTSSSGNMDFSSGGGTGGFSFNGVINASILKLGGTVVTATAAELNAHQSEIDANQTDIADAKVRHVSITHADAGAATPFGTALADGSFVSRVVVKVTTAFDSNVGTLQIGDGTDADGFGSVSSSDLQSVGSVIIQHAAFLNEALSESKQLKYTLGGSASAGACVISVQQELK